MNTMKTSPNGIRSSAGWVVLLGFTGIFAGVLSSFGSPLLVFSCVALAAGLVLVFFPALHLATTLLFSLLLAGTLETFFYFGQANWGASLIAGSLILGVMFSRPKARPVDTALKVSWQRSLLITGLVSYFLCIVLSVIFNQPSLPQLLVGLRNYCPFLGVLLILALGRISEKDVLKCVYAIIAAGCVQWIYCLLELVIVAPQRAISRDTIAAGGSAEAMLGSFGGNGVSGGYTGEMAAFLAMNLILCTVFWQAKLISRRVWLLAAVSAGISIGLAETKIVIVLFPLTVIAVAFRFPGGLSRRVLTILILGLLSTALVAGIYANRFWTSDKETIHALTYSFDPDFRVTKDHRGRVASIVHWLNTGLIDGPIVQGLIGHGPAASQEASMVFGEGNAVTLYGPGLDNNAVSKIAWDFGLIGCLAFVLIIVASFLEAVRLSNTAWLSEQARWTVVGLKAFLVTFAVLLPYQVSVVGPVAMQFLFWFSVGLVMYFGSWRAEQVNGPSRGKTKCV